MKTAFGEGQSQFSISEILGEESLDQRLAEIRAAIERMDFRWDQGFITDRNDYLEKRVKLQQDLEQLTPISNDDLERAVDMLENFGSHWQACKGDPEAQHRLVALIVERVYVQDEEVVAMTLKADYHVVLGHKLNGSTEISVEPSVYTCGIDGVRARSGYTVLISRENYSPAIRQLIKRITGSNSSTFLTPLTTRTTSK